MLSADTASTEGPLRILLGDIFTRERDGGDPVRPHTIPIPLLFFWRTDLSPKATIALKRLAARSIESESN